MTVDTFQSFIQKWVTPATIVIAFGAIVWGVQTNAITIQNAKAIEKQSLEFGSLASRIVQTELNAQRTAILLEQATSNLTRLQRAVNDHLTEAEAWKRRIIRNQDAINNSHKEGLSNGNIR